ncbi:octopamine receptor beta-2R-like [Mercenaria mercenaria]|uniref:octopamine receptor beta-2R-like n=1 Tax=Mercenaria mercenaria TaxID=6596 RepID=UPI00234E3DCC|nr:octopamine receptor beta-2R-like [Mercenaria mercenaria]
MYMEGSKAVSDHINQSGKNDSFFGNDSMQNRQVAFVILKTTVMIIIMLGAVFGNILVVIAVMKFQRLRAITNYFIVSLAFADFLVAILVMPFNASIEISGKWIFGRIMCDVYNSNDVLFSTASILHLCCISMDRYIAIIHPFKYESKMTRCRVFIMIAITWISSILISYIPIQSHWYTTSDTLKEMENSPEECLFIVNKVYAVISSSISFWIPCTIMVFVYLKIFMEARRQETQIKQSGYHLKGRPSEQTNLTDDQSERRNERKRMRREHKAAKTLGIIMGAFVFCFLPFFTWYLVTTLCGESCPYPQTLGSALFWLGYLNSCLNPIIYAYFNRDFRSAFRKLLKCSKFFGGSNSENNSGVVLTAGQYENRDNVVHIKSDHLVRNGNKSHV